MGLKMLRLGPRNRLIALATALAAVAAYAIFLIATGIPTVNAVPGPAKIVAETVVVATSSRSTSATTTVQANATVVRVVDGDTLVAKLDAEPGEWTIRFLGIDTPETVDPRKPVQCMGKQASDFSKALLTGKRVRLVADLQADERDMYGRLLRNILLEDGTDVNARLVREGYAHAYLSFPLTPARKVELKGLQEQAKTDRVGLWDPAICP